MEAFRSSESLKKHADIISDEQKRILQYYDEMKVDPPISREEVEEFMRFIQESLNSMFEGADEVFEVEPCGAYRRDENQMKDIDILIIRND